jgi:hypothetical protein
MIRIGLLASAVFALLVYGVPQAKQSQSPAKNLPKYTADGRLEFPENYREWVFLTSGLNMSYNPTVAAMDHAMFDNVFVNPESYKVFRETGTWPDKTMFVLEVRMAGDKASINKAGHFQTPGIMGREIHVKDESRFPGKWAFFGFEDEKPGTAFAKDMPCYSCHEQHGAVDTTFVQFYPTLIELAQKKGTLSEAYKKDEAAKEQTTDKQ